MPFFKSQVKLPVREKGGSPYLDGREEWLERYGSYINRAAQWRMVAFLCLLITGVSITGNVIQASQTKTIPYIIEVDALGKAAVMVEWVETVRSHAGVMLDSHNYEATVTIQINPPTVDAVLLRNPGGVYITALSAGKVVGTPAPVKPQNNQE